MYTIILDSSNTELSIGLVKEGILLDTFNPYREDFLTK